MGSLLLSAGHVCFQPFSSQQYSFLTPHFFPQCEIFSFMGCGELSTAWGSSGQNLNDALSEGHPETSKIPCKFNWVYPQKKNNYVHKTCDHSKHLLWESKIHLLYLKRETNTSHLQQYCHPIWYLPTHANNKYPAAPAQTSQSWTGTHTFSPKVVEREMEETSTRRG